MSKHSDAVLQFPDIIEQVKNHAATKVGREIISRLTPVYDLGYVSERLKEVTAARELLEEFGSPSFGGIRDLRETMARVVKGMVLSPGEIVDIQNTLGGFRNVVEYFREVFNQLDPRVIENRYQVITSIGDRMELLPDLEREINRCIDEYGDVKSSASKKLSSLRREMDSIENKVRDRLESIIRGSKYQSMLQDALITRRENRYVVPVKHEYRNSFEGIVHDHSASGMTYFMEPMAIVKLNNRLREVKSEEEAEIYRIMQQLTGVILEKEVIITANLKTAALLDVIFARAAYSRQIDGLAPEINDQGMVAIKEGRHPLLTNKPVPISIEVGRDFNTLVITGPNTGGKTVALKTVGLFVLMTQAGLHIPAGRGTVISLFKNVFADIGDEQSIEQNLSTFSSHMNKINSYLSMADEKTLVLLDELGVGTDPREGAALGIAMLEELKKRKVVTIATTHYSQLKSYAYSSPGVENASVEFDLQTLKPTYRLLMGIPGGSNAFAIALKLGLPEEIINEARKLVDSDELEVESIIADLNKQRKKYRELQEELERSNQLAAASQQKYEQLNQELDSRKQQLIEEANSKADEIIEKTKKDVKKIIQELKEQNYDSRSEVDRMANQIHHQLKDIDYKLQQDNEEDNDLDQTINVGDQVRVNSVGQKGEVLNINPDKNEVTIQAGIMTITAGLEDLVKVKMPQTQQKEMINKYRVQKTSRVSPTLDLRGERYENAQHTLDKYLDDAFLAGLKSVEIIHGKGTGVIREAVNVILNKNPHVSSFRLGRQEEGGSGVTIASLD